MINITEKKVIFFLLCCGCLTISLNVAAIAAALPAIRVDLNLSEIDVAKIISFYLVPYGLGALIYAPLTRYFPYRKVLGFSLAVYASASFYCASVNALGPFCVGRVLSGISGAGTIPLGLMLIGKIFDREVRGRLVGVFFACSFFASLIGITLSGLAHWRWLFVVPAVLGALTAGAVFLLKNRFTDDIFEGVINYWHVFRHRQIKHLFIFIFIISFLYHGVHKWFGIYLDQIYQLDKLQISFFFIVMALCGAAGQMIGGYISDKKGRHAAWQLGLILLGMTTLLLSLHFPIYILTILMGLFAMGWTIGHNGISTVLTDFPEKYRQEIASLNSSVRFLSGGIGFAVSGFFVVRSFSLTFLFIGILILLNILYINKIINMRAD